MRLAFLLFAQAVPLMLVMHLLFPRIQGALWGLPQDAYAGMTGMSEEMHPGSINELSLSDEVAFRAYFNAGPPAPADLYWRVLVLTRTDGRNWTRDIDARASPAPQPDGPALAYTLVVEPSNKPWLPALELPARPPAGVTTRSGFALETAQPIRERQTYDLRAYPHYRALKSDPNERRDALALPLQTSARVRDLAAGLRAGHDDAATARAILQYFYAQNFSYTLTPPLLGADPVDEFLFETRRGFCEHYATAFVVLARAAGIPARVVAGYQGGEFNPAGRYYIVRQSDAHAWVELWLAGRGWTRADPTAAVSPERIEYGAEVLRRLLGRGVQLGNLPPGALDLRWFERVGRDARLALDTVRSGWQRWVLGYNTERQREFLAALGLGEFGAARLIGVLAGIVALILAGYLVYNRPRSPRLDPAQRAYRDFCRKLARAGLVRRPHEGPRDFATRCARRLPGSSANIGAISELYGRLRYGDENRPEELRDFIQQVRHFHVSA
jgi:transglutaminase-like putative cysteine protease